MNADYQALIATGLPFRIATQQRGTARAYLGSYFVIFHSNNMNAAKLESKAPAAKAGTHLADALHELIEDSEAIRVELARVEREALSQATQAAPSRKALTL